jgi:hypothetical protein
MKIIKCENILCLFFWELVNPQFSHIISVGSGALSIYNLLPKNTISLVSIPKHSAIEKKNLYIALVYTLNKKRSIIYVVWNERKVI